MGIHLKDNIANVEYGQDDVVSISGKVVVLNDAEDLRVAHVGAVDEGQQVDEGAHGKHTDIKGATNSLLRRLIATLRLGLTLFRWYDVLDSVDFGCHGVGSHGGSSSGMRYRCWKKNSGQS